MSITDLSTQKVESSLIWIRVLLRLDMQMKSFRLGSEILLKIYINIKLIWR